MNRRPMVTALAAVTAAMLVAPVAANAAQAGATAGVVHGAKQVTSNGVSTTRDHLQLLAGAGNQVVYRLATRVTDEVFHAPDDGQLVPATPADLVASSQSGPATVLGAIPGADQVWSTAGDVVAGSPQGTHPDTVDLWSISTKKRQRVALDSSEQLLSAVPGGVAFAEGDAVEFRNLSGQVTSWGTPFAGHPPTQATTDGTDLVVTDASGQVAVMTYAAPGSYQQLQSGSSSQEQCDAVDSVGVGCIDADSNPVFIPIGGGAPTIRDCHSCASGVGLAGTTLLWIDTGSDSAFLDSQQLADPTATLGRTVGFDLVTADGGVVVDPDPDTVDDQLLRATSATDVSVLEQAPLSPQTAGSFSLTSGRLSYVSDRRDATHPHQLTTITSVKIRATAHRVRLGSSTKVAGIDGKLQVRPAAFPGPGSDETVVAAAGDITAYAVGSTTLGADPRRLRVAVGDKSVTLPGAFDSGNSDTVDVSGDRVVYTIHNATHPFVGVYDVHTRHLQRLFTDHVPRSIALAGPALAYSTRGHVYRLDLRTDRRQLVFHDAKIGAIRPIVVSAYGSWVGWDIAAPHPSVTRVDGVRNLRTGRVIHLSHVVAGLNAQGVLLESAAAGTDSVTTWFRPYSGSTHLLLSSRRYDELPEIAGHAIAWVNVDGNLEIAPSRY
jgi:hypothetical protein